MPKPDLQSRYARSLQMLQRAEKVIPLGSQTFSKSKVFFQPGAAPLFVERGEGCRLWDVDGNEYIDFICSLGAITLGHGDPDVLAAVRRQLEDGVLFSLPSPKETALAELIVEAVPCAEMVRFGKNGSDATAGCVRLARAKTGRDRVAVCGYHGWQDWYIGSTSRDLGVPAATKALTHSFTYNDIDSLLALFRKHPGEFAAVIMEPLNTTEPSPDFFPAVRELCTREGVLLIFDEVITGFRFAPGTAQQMLGVTPDLTSLGKGMGNGFPISAVVGRAEIMKLMEEVFFSFTMGGEAVSIAAAIAVIEKGRKVGLYDHLQRIGTMLKEGISARIRDAGLQEFLGIVGHPAWAILTFSDTPAGNRWALQTLFMQESLRRGILTNGAHFLNLAHDEEAIGTLLNVYEDVFAILARAIRSGDLSAFLSSPPIEPIFRVRESDD